jgi:putative flippase GtrA
MIIKNLFPLLIPIFKFILSCLSSGVIDFILLIILKTLTGNLFLSVIIARICSSVFNYIVNKYLVFMDSNNYSNKNSAYKYFLISVFTMLINYGFMHIFNEIIDITLVFSKLITEGILFVFSYWSQSKFVFEAQKP